MNPDEFSSAILNLWQRIETLRRRAYESNPSELPLAVELLEELNSTLEELRVAEEELHQQTEALSLSREALAAEHQRYQELFNFAPDGYVVTDPMGIIVEANLAAAILLNAPQEHLLRKPLGVFIAFDDRDAFRRQLTWLQEGDGIREWEVRVQPRHKPAFPAVLSCTASRDAQRKVVGLRWLLRDISERKRAEEAIHQANQVLERQVEERSRALQALNDQLREDIARRTTVEGELRTSLQEKEVLLREVHHRVKNNMQVVSSLLNLQASQTDDAHIRELFQESHHRIHTMALIHDTIYASRDLANIDLATFTATLASYLKDSYGLEGDRVALHINVDDVVVPPDAAIPYGLILNELVSNCLKHAFPDGQGGEVRITLQQVSASQATLIVQDNGRGIPAEIDVQNPDSLGLQLVHALAGQLRGTIALDRAEGTAFILTFHLSA
jgi:PAS domain S-box-containing protein